MYYSTNYTSPIGTITLVSKEEKLIGLWNEGQKYYGSTIRGDLTLSDELAIFATVKKWLNSYFAGENPKISELPLAPEGSEFRKMVWEILCEIPYGNYTTYGEIANLVSARMGKEKMSSQAVGGAVGHNPISIIIPCHRVVGKNGSLTGYAGGIDKKIKLLEHEGVDISQLFVPKRGTVL